jgi:hypothetical protein
MNNTKYSRRKYAESVRYLKSAIANDGLSFAFRRRCVELLLVIYGLPVPETGGREKRAVKELVTERAIDKTLHREIREQVAEKVRGEAEQQAKDEIDEALKAFLAPTERASSPVHEKEAADGQ